MPPKKGKKRKKRVGSACAMPDMPATPRLHGSVDFPPEYNDEDSKEINRIGYLVKGNKVDREDYLS